MSPLSILDSFCLINDSRSFKYRLHWTRTVAAALTSPGASLSGKICWIWGLVYIIRWGAV